MTTFKCPKCNEKTLKVIRENEKTNVLGKKLYNYAFKCSNCNFGIKVLRKSNQNEAYTTALNGYASLHASGGGGATPFPPPPPIEETETINYVASAAGGGAEEEDSGECGDLAAFNDNLVDEVPEYVTESGYSDYKYFFSIFFSTHASLKKGASEVTDLKPEFLEMHLSAPKSGDLGYPLHPKVVKRYCNDPLGSVASMHKITKLLRKVEEIEYDEYKNTIFDFANFLYPHDPPIEGSIFDWLTKNVTNENFDILFPEFITLFINPTKWNVHKLFNDSYMNYAYNLNDFETKVIEFRKKFTIETTDIFLESCKQELLKLHLQFIRYNFFEYAGPIVKKSRHRTRTGKIRNQEFGFSNFMEGTTSRGISVIIYEDTPLFELLNYWFITQNIGAANEFAKIYASVKTREGSKIYPEFGNMHNFLVWMFITYGGEERDLMLANFRELITLKTKKKTTEYAMTTQDVVQFIRNIRKCTINWNESLYQKYDSTTLKTMPVKWFNLSCMLDNREKRKDPSKENYYDSNDDIIKQTQISQNLSSEMLPDEYNLKTQVGDFGYDSKDKDNQPIIVKMQQTIDTFLAMNTEIDEHCFEDPFYMKLACNEPLAHILKTIVENAITFASQGVVGINEEELYKQAFGDGGGAKDSEENWSAKGGKKTKRSRATKRRKTRKHK
jgi:hypothetical protein